MAVFEEGGGVGGRTAQPRCSKACGAQLRTTWGLRTVRTVRTACALRARAWACRTQRVPRHTQAAAAARHDDPAAARARRCGAPQPMGRDRPARLPAARARLRRPGRAHHHCGGRQPVRAHQGAHRRAATPLNTYPNSRLEAQARGPTRSRARAPARAPTRARARARANRAPTRARARARASAEAGAQLSLRHDSASATAELADGDELHLVDEVALYLLISP